MREFNSDSQALASLVISIYVIGLAVGPLFLSPLSELYGRTPLMHATNFAFLLSAIACGVSVNIPMLLIFRMIMGASTISLGGGYVADVMEPERRARGMNVWTVGPVLVRSSSTLSLLGGWRGLTLGNRHRLSDQLRVALSLSEPAGGGPLGWWPSL